MNEFDVGRFGGVHLATSQGLYAPTQEEPESVALFGYAVAGEEAALAFISLVLGSLVDSERAERVRSVGEHGLPFPTQSAHWLSCTRHGVDENTAAAARFTNAETPLQHAAETFSSSADGDATETETGSPADDASSAFESAGLRRSVLVSRGGFARGQETADSPVRGSSMADDIAQVREAASKPPEKLTTPECEATAKALIEIGKDSAVLSKEMAGVSQETLHQVVEQTLTTPKGSEIVDNLIQVVRDSHDADACTKLALALKELVKQRMEDNRKREQAGVRPLPALACQGAASGLLPKAAGPSGALPA